MSTEGSFFSPLLFLKCCFASIRWTAPSQPQRQRGDVPLGVPHVCQGGPPVPSQPGERERPDTLPHDQSPAQGGDGAAAGGARPVRRGASPQSARAPGEARRTPAQGRGGPRQELRPRHPEDLPPGRRAERQRHGHGQRLRRGAGEARLQGPPAGPLRRGERLRLRAAREGGGRRHQARGRRAASQAPEGRVVGGRVPLGGRRDGRLRGLLAPPAPPLHALLPHPPRRRGLPAHAGEVLVPGGPARLIPRDVRVSGEAPLVPRHVPQGGVPCNPLPDPHGLARPAPGVKASPPLELGNQRLRTFRGAPALWKRAPSRW